MADQDKKTQAAHRSRPVSDLCRKFSVFVVRGSYSDIRLSHKYAWSFVAAGYDVTMVVKKTDREHYQGAEVRRVSGPFDSILRLILNPPFQIVQAMRLKSDLYVLSNPHTIPLAFALRFAGKRVIYDTSEDFSKRMQLHDYIPRRLRRMFGRIITRLEKSLARRVNLVTVTQPQQRQQLDGNTVMIENTPLVDGPVVKEAQKILVSLPEPELFTLVYIGTITEYRGIFTMLNLLGRLNERIPCRLKMIGWFGDENCERLAREHPSWNLVEFHERLTHAETLAHLHRAHIGLAILHDVADHATSSVTKLYEYMWAGVPFVASNFDRWMRSVGDVSAGIFVDPLDTDRQVEVIIRLAEEKTRTTAMGAAGREFIQESFNWTLTGDRLLQAVTKVLDDEPDSTES